MTDQVKICKRVEVDAEQIFKEAIDQLLGNKKPVLGLDFNNVRFTDNIIPTNNQEIIEFPNNVMRGQLKLRAEDFWLSGVENNNGGCRFNFIGSNGKRTE